MTVRRENKAYVICLGTLDMHLVILVLESQKMIWFDPKTNMAPTDEHSRGRTHHGGDGWGHGADWGRLGIVVEPIARVLHRLKQ